MRNNGIQPGPIPGAPAPATAPDPEAQRVAQERQRIAQEREAARASRLFAGESRTPGSGPSAAGLEMPGAASPQLGALAAGSGQPTPPPREGTPRSASLGGARTSLGSGKGVSA